MPIIRTAAVPGLNERFYDLLCDELNGDELGGKSVGKSLVEDKLVHLLNYRH
jgi:hypothetical protein